MTAVNCILSPDWVAVATDTLASDPQDWGPLMLMPKAHFLPTAGALFACAGYPSTMTAAYNLALTLSARGVDDISAALSPVVRSAFAQSQAHVRAIQADDDTSWEMAGRLYLFGWSDRAGRFVGYSYGPESDFAAVAMADGVHVNPPVFASPGAADPLAAVQSPYDLCDLTATQQALELEKPAADQNLIGGDVMLYTLSRQSDAERGDPVTMQTRRMWPLEGQAGHAEAIRTKWAGIYQAAGSEAPPTASEWDRCADWLEAAHKLDDGSRTFADVRAGYLSGRYRLIAGDRGALLAEVVEIEGEEMAHLYLAGGELGEIRDRLLPRLQSYARAAGCRWLMISGRKGWARAFRGEGFRVLAPIDPARNWWLVGKLLGVAA